MKLDANQFMEKLVDEQFDGWTTKSMDTGKSIILTSSFTPSGYSNEPWRLILSIKEGHIIIEKENNGMFNNPASPDFGFNKAEEGGKRTYLTEYDSAEIQRMTYEENVVELDYLIKAYGKYYLCSCENPTCEEFNVGEVDEFGEVCFSRRDPDAFIIT